MSLERKLGESLIRTLIAKLDERVSLLEQQQSACRIGPRLARYRRRWIQQDLEKLTAIARRYGFKV